MAKGNFIEYVVSDNPNKYPNDGEQSGYYYELVEDVTPEVTAQTPVITQILEGLVGKAQGANATADKILEGYSAYVGQELVEGTAKAGLDLSGLSFSAATYGSITPSSDMTTISITHDLGVIPKLFIIFTETTPTTKNAIYYGIAAPAISSAKIMVAAHNNSYGAVYGGAEVSESDSTASETTISSIQDGTWGENGTPKLLSGITYKWIAIA